MARRKSAEPQVNLIDAFTEFSRNKNIDRATLMGVLEEVFRTMIRKEYGSDENFEIIVNVDKGDIQGFREREVVEDFELEDEMRQIPLSEALTIDPDYEVGDDLAEEINFFSFGRKIVQTAKQTLTQKIRDLEKAATIAQYEDMVGTVIIGEIYQVWRNEILVSHEGTELVLPKGEQIPKDRFRKGDTIRAVITDVQTKNGNPRIIISRAAPLFLEKLFEQEVPEIHDGLINIRGIVREPGERAKVAVESYDDRVDPVGACVGMKGSRIHGIVRELRNENIDVISFTTNDQLYIQRALSPAKITRIDINEGDRAAEVFLNPDQISLAIGKNGLNIKLASKLCNYQIDVYRETDGEEEDIDLDQFTDEIDQWILEEFNRIGCDTAKDVLELSMEELVRRTDLDVETLENVLAVLNAEFEEDEGDA
ncbi:transcription termination factor NusA [Pontibacter sp. G13]|uniref:transcription termination factor NusA n=1 Tax=Pontibacter sp. G13 TaxID=3074898 RepID=UPI00288A179D|nr:transcription termination factor NusA [Pontibacter sp. G13]WNJ16068.1 transcription termination factor NusA [Pontibacter sp. G13]